MKKSYIIEVKQGERFQFGENWRHFLLVLNDKHIAEAEKSLKQMLKLDTLQDKSFLDIGSGSGLFSLAAHRLGAKVYSFDYDHDSVACTQELKRRYFSMDDSDWIIDEGSVLDLDYLKSLGQFDIVYSWGVLHHTGDMWRSLENVSLTVANGGQLFIAIYNDQGGWSKRWKQIKKTYNTLPKFFRLPFAILVLFPREIKLMGVALLTLRINSYIQYWLQYHENRGMSRWYDLIDWIGGYPFEVAKPEEIFGFYRARGYTLERLKTCAGGLGCNQFLFSKQ
ncbi:MULTISPECIES: class I SAM-dependent methyltransferase [unclassified Nostoc]|uniref:class I SAM-dependent methyltransferase n=1 Tax=unclassified Nostoc TaxID=2593658 RepID=UPI002AD2C165|nr:class I SAM-dependent methyltransferase [Nostoc sp. ChiQUE02]MDZ8235523.1 class I SAM-dependent methyltransferase [Nostoc sp. ChiQUE02]